MNVNIDLPDSLLRRAEAVAVELNIPIGELVADALGQRLDSMAEAKAVKAARDAAEEECKQLWEKMKQPDGSYFNPDGIPNDDPFFAVLESLRQPRLYGDLPFEPERATDDPGATSTDHER